jgi:hypothetical protein
MTGIFFSVTSPEITIGSSVKYDVLSVEITIVPMILSSSAMANLSVKLEPKIRDKKTKMITFLVT